MPAAARWQRSSCTWRLKIVPGRFFSVVLHTQKCHKRGSMHGRRVRRPRFRRVRKLVRVRKRGYCLKLLTRSEQPLESGAGLLPLKTLSTARSLFCAVKRTPSFAGKMGRS